VVSSPSTDTLNVLLERNKLIRIIKLAEKCNLDTLHNNSVCYVVLKAFSISKNRKRVLVYHNGGDVSAEGVDMLALMDLLLMGDDPN